MGNQRKLDAFCHWYNTERPHQGIDGLTPNEAWTGEAPDEPISLRSMDGISPHIQVTRRSYRGDPCLRTIRISVAA